MEKVSAISKKQVQTRRIATAAMMVGIAYVVMLFTKVPLMASAEFLKYEPKDVVLLLGAYLLGPVTGVLMSFSVCFLEMITVSESGPIGFLMNFLASIAFILPASLLYRRFHNAWGAIGGLACSVVLMVAAMLTMNYFLTPIYMQVDRAVVEGMLIPIMLPFNLLKGILNAAFTLILYKPLVRALRSARVIF